MKTIKENFLRVKQRPFILIFIMILCLVLCYLEHFNSITEDFGSIKTLVSYDYLDVLSSLAGKASTLGVTPELVIISCIVIVLLLFAVSAVASFFFSGYSQMLFLGVLKQKKRPGEFKSGVNRHFGKLTIYFFLAIVFSAIFIVMMLYTVVPAIMTIKLFLEGDTSVIFQMMLLCVLTAAVLFFAVLFFVMYLSFLMPSLVGFKRGGTTVAFRMVNGYCWYLIPRSLLFIFLMLLIRVGLLAVGYGLSSQGFSMAVFLVSWILNSIIVFFYINYVFSTFVAMKDDMFSEV